MINLIAKKIGMSHLYKESGSSVPLTMIQLYENCVVDVVKNEDKELILKKLQNLFLEFLIRKTYLSIKRFMGVEQKKILILRWEILFW
jgi:ribosomal protein L3